MLGFMSFRNAAITLAGIELRMEFERGSFHQARASGAATVIEAALGPPLAWNSLTHPAIRRSGSAAGVRCPPKPLIQKEFVSHPDALRCRGVRSC
jgi:hypothetical protein